jgi:hypothetical protein
VVTEPSALSFPSARIFFAQRSIQRHSRTNPLGIDECSRKMVGTPGRKRRRNGSAKQSIFGRIQLPGVANNAYICPAGLRSWQEIVRSFSSGGGLSRINPHGEFPPARHSVMPIPPNRKMICRFLTLEIRTLPLRSRRGPARNKASELPAEVCWEMLSIHRGRPLLELSNKRKFTVGFIEEDVVFGRPCSRAISLAAILEHSPISWENDSEMNHQPFRSPWHSL